MFKTFVFKTFTGLWKLIHSIARFLLGITFILALLPILGAWLYNHSTNHHHLGVVPTMFVAWLSIFLIIFIGFLIKRCIALYLAKDALQDAERELDVYRKRVDAIRACKTSTADRQAVSEELVEAEEKARNAAQEYAATLSEELAILQTWRDWRIRSPQLRNDPVSTSETIRFMTALDRNSSAINKLRSQIDELVTRFGISSPLTVPTPFPPWETRTDGTYPKHRVGRTIWGFFDIQCCFLRSLADRIAIHIVNARHAGRIASSVSLIRGRKVLWISTNTIFMCLALICALAIPPLLLDKDIPCGRECARMLCNTYLSMTPRLEIPSMPSPVDVPYLHIAAATGRRIATELFLSAGASPDEKLGFIGPTPRECASWLGHTNLLALLPPTGNEPLHTAITEPDLVKARQIIKTDPAQVGRPDPIWGLSPMHYASASGNKDGVKLLLENGADINAVLKDPRPSPLSFAVLAGNEDMVETLLADGANMGTRMADDPTPIVLSIINMDGITRHMLELALNRSFDEKRYRRILGKIIEAKARITRDKRSGPSLGVP